MSTVFWANFFSERQLQVSGEGPLIEPLRKNFIGVRVNRGRYAVVVVSGVLLSGAIQRLFVYRLRAE